MDIKETIGTRLKELRKDKNITREDLAEKTDIKIYSLIAYEDGKQLPPIDNILKLADYFGVSLDYLTGRTDGRLLYRFHKTDDSEYEFVSIIVGILKQIAESKDPIDTINLCNEIQDKITSYPKQVLAGISLALGGLVREDLDNKKKQVDELMKALEEKNK